MKALLLLLCAQVVLGVEYSLTAELMKDRYQLWWHFDGNETIFFKVKVKTTGWVGFGISPNGNMVGSDVIIGWVKGGTTYFNDRHVVEHAMPPVDSKQNWFLLNSEEKDGYTTLEFKRKIVTCDPEDLDIIGGTSRVVFSYNENDPSSPSNILYHGEDNRSSKSINLLTSPIQKEPTEETVAVTLAMEKLAVPAASTSYLCRGFTMPTLEDKHHIVKVEPNIQEDNEAVVHHMLLYECSYLDSNDLEFSGDCYSGSTPNRIRQCNGGTPIAAWAVGGNSFIFPSHVGYPIGGANGPKYAVIEIHYNNPSKKADIVDSSGFNLHYTDQLRPNDAGILTVGHAVTTSMIIPPNTKGYQIHASCPGECTQALPEGGINVLASLLHSHVVGTALWSQHVRGDDELPALDRNDHYDFNYQEFAFFQEEVAVKPGDTIMTTCVYDTTNKTTVTLGGLSTTDEMCLDYLVYYPRIPNKLSVCLSLPTDFLQPLYENGAFASLPQEVIVAFSQGQISLEEALNNPAMDWEKYMEVFADIMANNNLTFHGCYTDTGTYIETANTVSPLPIKNPYQKSDPCEGLSESSTQEEEEEESENNMGKIEKFSLWAILLSFCSVLVR